MEKKSSPNASPAMGSTVILFGGRSEEKLVSVATAQNIARHLPNSELCFIRPQGPLTQVTHEQLAQHKNAFVQAFSPNSKDFAASLPEGIDFFRNKNVFFGLHGTEGEDGKYQRIFEENRIAFTGSGSAASALCFDKILTKEKARTHGIPLAEQLSFSSTTPPGSTSPPSSPNLSKNNTSREQAWNQLKDFFSRAHKIVLKPNANGSSVGLHIVKDATQLEKAWAAIGVNFTGYLAETFIEGRELTVGVYDSAEGLMALPASEVVLDSNRTFDYEGKYLGLGSQELTPAPITEAQMKMAQDLALRSHQIFGCYGYSRTDMIMTKDEKLVFLETNTLPGLTSASFFPQQLEAAKISFSEFAQRLIQLAQSR